MIQKLCQQKNIHLLVVLFKTLKVGASDSSTTRAIKKGLRSDLDTDPSVENMINITTKIERITIS